VTRLRKIMLEELQRRNFSLETPPASGLLEVFLVRARRIYETATSCMPSPAAFRRNASSSRSVRLLSK